MYLMLVSYSWLRQYVKLPDSLTPEELALKLTMSTVEVEKVDDKSKSLENIVVGKILKIEKHPDADKLKLCKVDIKNEKLDIVCGGSNLEEGMLVAVAKIGAKVFWHGEGEPVEMKKTKIRGVESCGMICASDEVGLGEMFPKLAEAEILDLSLVLPASHQPAEGIQAVGKPLSEALALNDVVFDIDNKSMTHRPDLWGHYGLAREVATLYHKDLKEYGTSKIKEGKKMDIKVKVEDKKLCLRYMAVAISGIEIKESPDWLKKYLLSVGLRPINNIVDITNYVLMDLGQPLHAFDAKHLETIDKTSEDKTIIVRRAKNKEEFTTLDGGEHVLDDSMLVIADEEKPVALAGVMGGLNSEINSNTATVVFESANFDAANIRRTALKLGLRTDSSARFEKSLDPLNTELALCKAVELTKKLCPQAEVISNVSDISDFTVRTGPIELDLNFVNRKIGQEIERKEIIRILESLGFGVKDKRDKLLVSVPSWRATKDISIPEDLVEEISRIYGYDNIKPKLPVFSIAPPEVNEEKELVEAVLDIVIRGNGFIETLNYSFVSGRQIELLGGTKEKYIELANPLSKEKPFLRRNLILNLLENIGKNIVNFDEIKLFEVGKTYLLEEPGLRVGEKSDELLPKQDIWGTAVYCAKKCDNPFAEVRRLVENLGLSFSAPIVVKKAKTVKPWQHPGRLGVLSLGKEEVGFVYELNPLTAQNFGINPRTGVMELNISKLLEVITKLNPQIRYQPIPEYPNVERDVALLLGQKVRYTDVVELIKKSSSLIKTVGLFDVYLGGKVEKTQKSCAYHLVYGSSSKTLTNEEVDKEHEKILKVLEKELGAEIRR